MHLANSMIISAISEAIITSFIFVLFIIGLNRIVQVYRREP